MSLFLSTINPNQDNREDKSPILFLSCNQATTSDFIKINSWCGIHSVAKVRIIQVSVSKKSLLTEMLALPFNYFVHLDVWYFIVLLLYRSSCHIVLPNKIICFIFSIFPFFNNLQILISKNLYNIFILTNSYIIIP